MVKQLLDKGGCDAAAKDDSGEDIASIAAARGTDMHAFMSVRDRLAEARCPCHVAMGLNLPTRSIDRHTLGVEQGTRK